MIFHRFLFVYHLGYPHRSRPSGNLHHRQIDASAFRQALDPAVALHRDAGAYSDPRAADRP